MIMECLLNVWYDLFNSGIDRNVNGWYLKDLWL